MKAKKQGAVIYAAIFSALMAFSPGSCGFLPEEENPETVSVGKDSELVQEINFDSGSMKLVWSDEFDYSGVPDTSKWKYQTGRGDNGWGNSELQYYISNESEAKTAVVENGMLKIKAYNEDGVWKSARMNSKQSWKYGFIEARMKITDKKGAWPAFWMMPQESVYGPWPKSGEIDIMENAPSTCGDHTVFSTLHAEGHSGGNGKSIGNKDMGANLSNEWHSFAVKWDSEEITAYYDGVAQ